MSPKPRQRRPPRRPQRVVREVCAILGADLDDPAQVRALRQDLVFARQNRVTSQRIGFGIKILIAVTLV